MQRIFLIFGLVWVINATHDCNNTFCPIAIPSQCPEGSNWGKSQSQCCDCCVNSKTGKCVELNKTQDCIGVACPLYIPAQCPSGATWEQPKGGCCDCCVNSKTGECVSLAGNTPSPKDCTGIKCPLYVPAQCPSGSTWEQPTGGCCNCCVNSKSGECVSLAGDTPSPTDCRKVFCPFIPTNPRCPTGSSLQTKNCCPCCVNQTGDCVNYLPAICPKRPCPNPLPPGRKCPPGATLGETIDPQSGCPNCPCCVLNVAKKCVPAISTSCPKYACIDALSNGEVCPTGSTWDQRSKANACPGCPCCVNSKMKCAKPVATTTALQP